METVHFFSFLGDAGLKIDRSLIHSTEGES